MRIVNVQIAGRAYPIFIGPGARAQLPRVIEDLSGLSRVAVIADEAVAQRHLGALLECMPRTPPHVLRFPAGEASKSLEIAATLYDGLAEARIGRRDAIITFGGGVAGDLGGFVAATWLRGVTLLSVPTSLEAAIDASVGGKTALNHRSGKNLIGAFHQPRAVLVDTDFLATLPQREFVAGLAESVKQAVMRDAAFFAWHEASVADILAQKPETLVELISRNCEIKADVVARDEREENLRQVLNYGHTVGHALEHVLGYELRHGECVALGMLVENEIAVERGVLPPDVAERIATLLEQLGIRTRLPHAIDSQPIGEAARMDKKSRGDSVFYVIPRGIGASESLSNVTDEELSAALSVIQP